MATAAEALNFIRSNYKTEQVSDRLLKMVFSFEDGRSQLVFVYVGDGMLVVSSPFADSSTSPAVALKIAEDTLFGIKVVANLYQVIHVVPTNDLDQSEVEFAIGSVAGAADVLEEQIGGDRF
jgi:hypothetical protein